VADACEYSSKNVVSITGGKFLDYLSSFYLHKSRKLLHTVGVYR